MSQPDLFRTWKEQEEKPVVVFQNGKRLVINVPAKFSKSEAQSASYCRGWMKAGSSAGGR